MGDSKNTPSKSTATQTATPEEQALTMRAIPAFMPGQQGLLTQQLAAGGYGTQPEWAGILSGMYSDMNVPVINGAQDIAALKKMNEAAAKAGVLPGGVAVASPSGHQGGSQVYNGSWAGNVTGGYDR